MVSARVQRNKRNVAAYIGAGIVPPQGGGDLTHPAGNGCLAVPADGYTVIGNKTVQTAKAFVGL